MRFLIHKRRNTPTIIIVALVDVLIVLLIFLMVTTTFKQQSALKLKLPESSQAQKSGANENPPLVVSIDTNGIYYLDKLPKTYRATEKRIDFAGGEKSEARSRHQRRRKGAVGQGRENPRCRRRGENHIPCRLHQGSSQAVKT